MASEKTNAPILVLGGTGYYGRNIVKSLLAKRQPVRVLSRNAANAREVLGDEAEIVEGDITSRESVMEALEGVKAVVIAVAAFTSKLIRKLKLIEQDSVLMALDEARKMGVSRIVYISVYDIREDWLKKLGSLGFRRVGVMEARTCSGLPHHIPNKLGHPNPHHAKSQRPKS